MTVKELREFLIGLPDDAEVTINMLGKSADATGVDWGWDGEKGSIEIHDYPN